MPCSQARRPKALRMWLLPVPLLPVMTRSSWRRTKSRRASSRTKALSSVGWKFQSKASRVLRSTQAAVAMMRRAMRASRLVVDLGGEDVLEQGGVAGSLAGGPGEQLVEVSRGCGSGRGSRGVGAVARGVRSASSAERSCHAAGSSGHEVCHRWARRRWRRGAADGEREGVVLGEVARGGDGLAERVVDAPGGVLGDVLVEGARGWRARRGCARRRLLERAEASGVGERGVDVGGVVALAQQEDLPGLMPPDPGGQGARAGARNAAAPRPSARRSRGAGRGRWRPVPGAADAARAGRCLTPRPRGRARGARCRRGRRRRRRARAG